MEFLTSWKIISFGRGTARRAPTIAETRFSGKMSKYKWDSDKFFAFSPA